jgi:hypothetical protein
MVKELFQNKKKSCHVLCEMLKKQHSTKQQLYEKIEEMHAGQEVYAWLLMCSLLKNTHQNVDTHFSDALITFFLIRCSKNESYCILGHLIISFYM